MNKKGEGKLLEPETLRIILSIIGILLLISLLASIYFAQLRNKELELAKASLNHLIDEINIGKTEVNILNPKGWVVTSFSGEVLPKLCLSRTRNWKSCVCICQAPTGAVRTLFLACETRGDCKESDFVVEGKAWTRGIEIKNPPLVLEINHENKMIVAKNEFG